MSTLTLPLPIHGQAPVAALVDTLKRRRRLVIGFALGFPVAFMLVLLAIVMIRYGDVPNYLTLYNWFDNVRRIIVSTGSVLDIIAIASDEWIFETGFMNYDYGNGIADWSLSLVPHKLAILALAGALIGLNFALLIERKPADSVAHQSLLAGATGLLVSFGVLAASVTNATVFSVVHCASPSWIGSFAVIGFDAYDLYPVEPYGPLICSAGLMALLVSSLLLAGGERVTSDGAQPATARV